MTRRPASSTSPAATRGRVAAPSRSCRPGCRAGRCWRGVLGAIALALLLLAASLPARAAVLAPADSAEDFLDTYNRWVFAWNHLVYSLVDRVTGGHVAGGTPNYGPPPAPPAVAAEEVAAPPAAVPSAGPRAGLEQVLSNLINEPLTMASSAVVGDFATAWNAAQRFAINSTVGLLGWRDEASGMGYPPVPADVGLSLCRMGIGEGGYVMLPFVGPRTYRDAVSDVVLVNALLWTTTGFLFASGVSLQTLIIAETIEVVADVVATRQIDPRAKAVQFDEYEQMRSDYLAQRRSRCAG